MNKYGQGTTPYLVFQIEGDLSEADHIVVTLRQGNVQLNLDKERVTVETEGELSSLIVHLTQEETLRFEEGRAQAQVRWTANEEAYITEEETIQFFRALYKGVI